MNSHSQWDRDQEGWRWRIVHRGHTPQWTGQKHEVLPEEPKWQPVEEEPMPDYEAGDPPADCG